MLPLTGPGARQGRQRTGLREPWQVAEPGQG
jgi:hypothetical protein